jgi:hypothetical protein
VSGPVEESTAVAAAPDDVYELVADLTRMGEWSPETTNVRWLGGATGPSPGARFRGSNRHSVWRWQTLCTVVTAEPGRELSWRASLLGMPVSDWLYTFESDGRGGTTLTESTKDLRGTVLRVITPAGTGVIDRAARNRETIRVTLGRIKAAAER